MHTGRYMYVYRASHHHLNNNPRARFLSLKFEVMNIGATRHSYFLRALVAECKCSPCRWFNKSWEWARAMSLSGPVRLLICKQQSTITDIIICSASHNIVYMYKSRRRSLQRSSAADQECAARARPGLLSPLINRINHSQSAFQPRFALAPFASSAKCAANPQISFLWLLRFVNNPHKGQIKGEMMLPCRFFGRKFLHEFIPYLIFVKY